MTGVAGGVGLDPPPPLQPVNTAKVKNTQQNQAKGRTAAAGAFFIVKGFSNPWVEYETDGSITCFALCDQPADPQ